MIAVADTSKKGKKPSSPASDTSKGKTNEAEYLFIEEQLHPRFWTWSKSERPALTGGVDAVLRVIMARLAAADVDVVAAYGILHDQDVDRVWSEARGEYYDRPKTEHVHLMFRVAEPIVPSTFARVIGMRDTDFIRPLKKGGSPVYALAYGGRVPYGWDAMAAYLVHEADRDKHRYSPDEVVTAAGPEYAAIHAERYQAWRERGARKSLIRDTPTVAYLTELALTGAVTKTQVMADPWLYRVYASTPEATRAVDHAWTMAGEQRAYSADAALRAGLLRTTVLYIHGPSGSGKSHIAERFIDHLVDLSAQVSDRPWSVYRAAPTNPLDTYEGQELLFLDEARPDSFSAPGWLMLMDPDRSSQQSARYRNRDKVAPRVIVITNTRPAEEFFLYTKGKGDLDEAMSQFIRRLTRVVEVHQDDDDRRTYSVSEVVRTDPHTCHVPTSSGVAEFDMDRRVDLIADMSDTDLFAHLAGVVHDRADVDFSTSAGWDAAQQAAAAAIDAFQAAAAAVDPLARLDAELTAARARWDDLDRLTRDLDRDLVDAEDAAKMFGDREFVASEVTRAQRAQMDDRKAIVSWRRELDATIAGLIRRRADLLDTTPSPTLSSATDDVCTIVAGDQTARAVEAYIAHRRSLIARGALPPDPPVRPTQWWSPDRGFVSWPYIPPTAADVGIAYEA